MSLRPSRSSGTRSSVGPRTEARSEEHTSELQSQSNLVCRLLLEKKKNKNEHILTQSTFIHSFRTLLPATIYSSIHIISCTHVQSITVVYSHVCCSVHTNTQLY